MGKEKEPNFGFPPGKPREELVKGLQEAIEATKRRIEEYRVKNWDASVFETHLEDLERRFEAAKKK